MQHLNHRGTRAVATGLVAAQIGLAIWHQASHDALGVVTPIWLNALLLPVVLLGPALAAGMLWTRHTALGWRLLLACAAIALTASLLGHYGIPSPDHVAHLPDGPGRHAFRWSAAGLALVQAGLLALAGRAVLCGTGSSAALAPADQSQARLAPIDRPRAPWLRLVYWLAGRRYGMVPTPFRVLLPRAPALMAVNAKIDAVTRRKLVLPPHEILVIKAYAATRNGCAFCADLTLAEALKRAVGRDRFDALHDPEAASILSEREKSALAIVRDYAETRRVTDATWARARRCFTARELIDVLWLNAAEQYFNALTLPLAIGSDGLARHAA